MQVRIFEVGPRDGLQNEKRRLNAKTKLTFIRRLARAGFSDIEVGSFVRPDLVPQMKDTDSIVSRLSFPPSLRTWALVPNTLGLERALNSGVKNIALFTAVTDGFNLANTERTVQQSLKDFDPVVKIAKLNKMKIRGYISTAFGCPFEGIVKPKNTLKVIDQLFDLGVDEVSVGDTIGVASPKQIENVFRPALKNWKNRDIAGHFHDTRGTALANALRALDLGVTTLDSSAGGLGGCPFAPGATGNLATEDLVYMLEQMGVYTGIDLRNLADTSLWLSKILKRPPASRYLQAYCS